MYYSSSLASTSFPLPFPLLTTGVVSAGAEVVDGVAVVCSLLGNCQEGMEGFANGKGEVTDAVEDVCSLVDNCQEGMGCLLKGRVVTDGVVDCSLLGNCHEGIEGLPGVGKGDGGKVVGPRLSKRALRDFNSCCNSARDCVWLSLFFSIIWMGFQRVDHRIGMKGGPWATFL